MKLTALKLKSFGTVPLKGSAPKVSKGRPESPLVAPQSEIFLPDSKLVVWSMQSLCLIPEGFPVALWTPSGVFSDEVDCIETEKFRNSAP